MFNGTKHAYFEETIQGNVVKDLHLKVSLADKSHYFVFFYAMELEDGKMRGLHRYEDSTTRKEIII